MIERSGLCDRLAHCGQALVGEAAQRQRSGVLAPAENTWFDAGLPHPFAVKGRIVQLEGPTQMRVCRLQVTEMEQRGAQRPVAQHLQVGIADSLEER